MQVAVSRRRSPTRSGCRSGDRLPAKDEFGRDAHDRGQRDVRADRPRRRDLAGRRRGCCTPCRAPPTDSLHLGRSPGLAESLPDLRFALPGDDLTRRVVFTPEPRARAVARGAGLERSIVSLQTSAGSRARRHRLGQPARLRAGAGTGPGGLGARPGAGAGRRSGGLRAARARPGRPAAGGQAKRGLAMVRQRGASLAGIAVELLLEGLLVAAAAADRAWAPSGSSSARRVGVVGPGLRRGRVRAALLGAAAAARGSRTPGKVARQPQRPSYGAAVPADAPARGGGSGAGGGSAVLHGPAAAGSRGPAATAVT